MMGWISTVLGLVMIHNARDSKQITIGGVIAGMGANMVARQYARTNKEL